MELTHLGSEASIVGHFSKTFKKQKRNKYQVGSDTYIIWRPPSLSELTPMIFNMGLTHLGSRPPYVKY